MLPFWPSVRQMWFGDFDMIPGPRRIGENFRKQGDNVTFRDVAVDYLGVEFVEPVGMIGRLATIILGQVFWLWITGFLVDGNIDGRSGWSD